MSLSNFLIIILLFLFAIDVIKKIYFTHNKNISRENTINNKIDSHINKNNQIEKEEEDEFSSIDDMVKNKKIEIIIKYDKFLHAKDFILLKNKIENDFKNIEIKGEEFPLPKSRRYFINFTYIVQIGTCLLLFFPKYLKIAMPLLSDNTFEFITKYNIMLIIANFILHFILNQHIIITGAFEIFFNNKNIYSKIETHNLPDIIKLKNVLKKIIDIN